MKSNSVQLGITAGIIAIIVSVAQVLLFSDVLGSGGFNITTVLNFLTFAVLVFFMFKAANDLKNNNGGYLRFKEALKSSYVVAIVATILTTIFSLLSKYLLFPELNETIQNRALAKSVEKMERQGLSEERIEQSIAFTEKIFDIGIWVFIPLALIFYFFISLIIAAIVKKNNPNLS